MGYLHVKAILFLYKYVPFRIGNVIIAICDITKHDIEL